MLREGAINPRVGASGMRIRKAQHDDPNAWIRLRHALWRKHEAGPALPEAARAPEGRAQEVGRSTERPGGEIARNAGPPSRRHSAQSSYHCAQRPSFGPAAIIPPRRHHSAQRPSFRPAATIPPSRHHSAQPPSFRLRYLYSAQSPARDGFLATVKYALQACTSGAPSLSTRIW